MKTARLLIVVTLLALAKIASSEEPQPQKPVTEVRNATISGYFSYPAKEDNGNIALYFDVLVPTNQPYRYEVEYIGVPLASLIVKQRLDDLEATTLDAELGENNLGDYRRALKGVLLVMSADVPIWTGYLGYLHDLEKKLAFETKMADCHYADGNRYIRVMNSGHLLITTEVCPIYNILVYPDDVAIVTPDTSNKNIVVHVSDGWRYTDNDDVEAAKVSIVPRSVPEQEEFESFLNEISKRPKPNRILPQDGYNGKYEQK